MTTKDSNTTIGEDNLTDEIRKNLLHAQAMLSMIWGGGINNFHDQPIYSQDNFLWACSDSVDRALVLFDKLDYEKVPN